MADAGSGKPGVGAMPEILRRVARFLRDKIGWQGLGFAICLGIIVFAFVVLYFQLRDIVFGEVLDALRRPGHPATPPLHLRHRGWITIRSSSGGRACAAR